MRKIKLTEQMLTNLIKKAVALREEEAGMDTPGGNPEYFYGDGSLDKLRNMNQDEVNELSTEEIIKNLWEIKRLLYERAPSIAMQRVTELIGKLGGDISRERDYPEAREGEDDWDGTQEHKDYLMTNPWDRGDEELTITEQALLYTCQECGAEFELPEDLADHYADHLSDGPQIDIQIGDDTSTGTGGTSGGVDTSGGSTQAPVSRTP